MKKNNLIRKVKQTTAGLLTAAMVLTGAPLGSMTAMAATTLQDNSELDPSSPIGANDGITRVNETGGAYTTYGQSQGTVYRFGKSSASSNYGGQAMWGGGSFTIQGNKNVAIAEDNANLHGATFVGANGHQYTFDIGAILDSDAVANDSKKTFGATGSYKASKSAFGANWWATYIGFGQTGEHKEANPTDMMPVISPRY